MNCIVVDMGTSTTFQLVSKDAVYKGLIIAPGLRSSGDTLIQKAARLQDIELTNPTKLLGLNTKESMLSGIVGSHIRMIESTVWEICKEYHEMAPFKVIITGGLAALIEPLIPHGYAYEPDLTLKGLNYARGTYRKRTMMNSVAFDFDIFARLLVMFLPKIDLKGAPMINNSLTFIN